MRNLSIGLHLSAGYGDHQGYGATTLTDTKSTSVSGGVRFGFNVPLSDSSPGTPPDARLQLDPQRHDRDILSNHRPPPPSSESSVGPWLNFYAPFLVHPVPHFFVGFGPRIGHQFAVLRGGPNDGSQSTLLGGDFGRERVVAGPPLRGHRLAATPIQHLFGKEGDLVLTLATSASLSSFSYSNSPGSPRASISRRASTTS